eukprot:768061-Hanusia_phi.AAC.4
MIFAFLSPITFLYLYSVFFPEYKQNSVCIGINPVQLQSCSPVCAQKSSTARLTTHFGSILGVGVGSGSHWVVVLVVGVVAVEMSRLGWWWKRKCCPRPCGKATCSESPPLVTAVACPARAAGPGGWISLAYRISGADSRRSWASSLAAASTSPQPVHPFPEFIRMTQEILGEGAEMERVYKLASELLHIDTVKEMEKQLLMKEMEKEKEKEILKKEMEKEKEDVVHDYRH